MATHVSIAHASMMANADQIATTDVSPPFQVSRIRFTVKSGDMPAAFIGPAEIFWVEGGMIIGYIHINIGLTQDYYFPFPLDLRGTMTFHKRNPSTHVLLNHNSGFAVTIEMFK